MRTRLPAPLLILLSLPILAAASDAPAPGTSPRQAQVREKGKDVMPFSLDKTVHSFDKTANGGVQRVRVRGEAPEQVAMIRSHLREIAASFTARNFDKPAHIHGADMPGLAAMKAARPGELGVRYRELDDGAEIAYSGRTPQLVAAIHAWFDAQLGDHGRDAVTATIGLEALAWLGGSWIIDDGKQRVEEFWSAPADDSMIGMSRTLRDGKTQSFEFMRIASRPDGVFFIAQPRGKPPVEFVLQSWDGAQAVFVNPGNGDHLKRIVYRRNADGTLTARVEGDNDGAAFVEDFPYRRAPAGPAG
jgi:hypothetical protein